MSNRYKGGVISATPPTLVAGAGASGTWTLEQQMQATAAGLWPVNGPFYIEDVFSTYLYTGNSSTQTITNGIDISGNGGLVWIKNRQTTIGVPIGHILTDTARGVTKFLRSQSTSAQETSASSITAFNSSGFSFGSDTNINYSGDTYASWTFREQPKFFDIVTYSGNGSTQTINHNLGSAPGCIIIKVTNEAGSNWWVWHRGDGTTFRVLNLDRTSASYTSSYANGDSVLSAAPTSTTFSVKNTAADLYGTNQTGGTYIAYLFAHDAGGFGLTGTDNVISCGSFTTGSYLSVTTVTLGYEPQWVMVKSTADENWYIVDNMRGMPVSGTDASLNPNLSAAESLDYDIVNPTATGFTTIAGSSLSTSATYIYVAIRRGPMAVPTLGTSVFSPVAYTGDGTTRLYSVGFPTDLSINSARSLSLRSPWWSDRLRGGTVQMFSDGSGAEGGGGDFAFDYQTSIYVTAVRIASGQTYINWCFRRAPGFFDEVCYTGTGANRTVTHNLTVAPELMIIKGRSDATAWEVYCSALANTEYLVLNTTAAKATGATRWNSTTPTSSVFSVGTSTTTNNSASTYVAYLFATCAGVSKVGGYTGTGTTQTINCGFTGGARFVLIKRTDSTGDWYMWDSARGIVAGNDPYLLLNTSNAEVTGTDYVDTAATGFEISSTAPAAINANGGTYIFLAIA